MQTMTIFLSTTGQRAVIGRGADAVLTDAMRDSIVSQGLRGWLVIEGGSYFSAVPPMLGRVAEVNGAGDAAWSAAIETYWMDWRGLVFDRRVGA